MDSKAGHHCESLKMIAAARTGRKSNTVSSSEERQHVGNGGDEFPPDGGCLNTGDGCQKRHRECERYKDAERVHSVIVAVKLKNNTRASATMASVNQEISVIPD